MTEDARVLFSRRSIDDALVALLEEKKLDAITVKELCERAEVSRATFYRHYGSVRGLMDSIEEEALATLQTELRFRKKDLGLIITLALSSLKSGGYRYQVLFSANGDPFFLEKIFSVAREAVDSELVARFPRSSASEREWLFVFFSKGSTGMWRYWLEQGMEEPVDDVVSFTMRLIESSMERM